MNLRATLTSAALCIAAVTTFNQPVIADQEIFEIVELTVRGRVVTAHFADFDGDQRKDLMLATLNGIPPAESRTIHVYLQQADGAFPDAASHSVPIPQWSAVYDVADLKGTPGDELVLLRPDGVTILSLANDTAVQWDLPIDAPSTVAAADDERGFDPFHMVYREFAAEPWILVPQIGAMTAITADGATMARIDIGRRANYYVAREAGLFSVESDIQVYLDVPKLSVGDVDGDGQADIVAATRHEVRVFLRDNDGRFASQPSHAIPLEFVSERDHIRGSGGVVTTAKDIDNDGRLDLMISHAEGTFSDTVTTTSIYRNRDGGWNIAEPDDRFVSNGALSSDLLMDVDDDERFELVRIQLKFSILEVVEVLLTRKVDAEIAIHRLQADGLYDAQPWSRKKISTAISFETFRPKGFMPTGGLDLNADGLMDFITSADGKGIEVYLGSRDGPLTNRTAIQKLSTTGVIRFADFDGDGMPDFVLFNSQTFDSPVRIGRNRGNLPGSPGLEGND